MLAKAILVHGVIGYKFCWLLPSEDHDQGIPTRHESVETPIGNESLITWVTLVHELKALDAINSFRLWLTWMCLCCELKALGSMNNFGLWLIWMTLSLQVKALDVMNNSGLWLTWTTLSHELQTLCTMNNSGLLMTWKTLGHELRVVDDMNGSRFWAQGYRYYEYLKVMVYMNDFELAYFERLWQRAMELQSLVLHEFELPKALP